MPKKNFAPFLKPLCVLCMMTNDKSQQEVGREWEWGLLAERFYVYI